MNLSTRRSFFKKAAIAGITAVSIPQIISAAMPQHHNKKLSINVGDRILFQGDSITDAGRKRDALGPNDQSALGTGYAFLASAAMLNKYASKNINIFNKGISGDKVFELANRWDEDCIALKPDILSIMIGVNDFWHKKNGNYEGTIDTYIKDYTNLLERTKKALPNIKLIIAEPFAVPGVKAVDASWFPAFSDYRKAVKAIAEKFDATFLPYQSVFEEAQKHAPGSYWTSDGVHTTIAGAQLMSEAWLECLK